MSCSVVDEVTIRYVCSCSCVMFVTTIRHTKNNQISRQTYSLTMKVRNIVISTTTIKNGRAVIMSNVVTLEHDNHKGWYKYELGPGQGNQLRLYQQVKPVSYQAL